MASAFHRMNSARQSEARPLTDNKSVRAARQCHVGLRLICDTVASLDARHSRVLGSRSKGSTATAMRVRSVLDVLRHHSCETGPMRTNEAEAVFRRYLEQRGLVVSRLTAEEAADAAIGFFESERADDVEAETGDMLLFQWGTYDWHDGNGPSFQLELARQFVLAGFAPDQADDAMWQLRLTLHYPASEAADALGAGHKWCERVADTDAFRTFIRTTPVMAFAAATGADRVELSPDQVG
jgi:hypothetical protein